jgi:GNAT superfamily N-acetyltransferase
MRAHGQWLTCDPVIGMRVTGFEDAPDTPCDDYYVLDASPAVVVAALASVPALANHYLTIRGDDHLIVSQYAMYGYHVSYSELLMALDLRIQHHASLTHTVVRATPADVEIWNQRDPERIAWIACVNLMGDEMPHYAIWQDDIIVARGRSLRMPDGTSYVGRIYTHPDYRRRGYGRALMHHIVAEDARAGVTTSILMAAPMAVDLYRQIGYLQVIPTHILQKKTP